MDAQQIQALGRQAMALHQQGHLHEAEAIYRRLIAAAPGLFPPYFLLGIALYVARLLVPRSR